MTTKNEINGSVESRSNNGVVMHAFVNGGRKRDLEKVSPKMWEALFGVHRSIRAVRYLPLGTIRALINRGLVDGGGLTPKGCEAITVEWKHPA